MLDASYQTKRGQLETYFDRTAVENWARLTSDAPVSGVRATVRAGREEMRRTLLSWLPADLRGKRVLDAGCGTGALAVEAARRGANVVAIDISPKLVALGAGRLPKNLYPGSVEMRVGDMFDPALGEFDHIVSMDVLIHYAGPDIIKVLAGFTARAKSSVLFTFAPQTTALRLLWAAGKLFPRGDRSPSLEPIAAARLHALMADEAALAGWQAGRSTRVSRGFYKSHALEVKRT